MLYDGDASVMVMKNNKKNDWLRKLQEAGISVSESTCDVREVESEQDPWEDLFKAKDDVISTHQLPTKGTKETFNKHLLTATTIWEQPSSGNILEGVLNKREYHVDWQQVIKNKIIANIYGTISESTANAGSGTGMNDYDSFLERLIHPIPGKPGFEKAYSAEEDAAFKRLIDNEDGIYADLRSIDEKHHTDLTDFFVILFIRLHNHIEDKSIHLNVTKESLAYTLYGSTMGIFEYVTYVGKRDGKLPGRPPENNVKLFLVATVDYLKKHDIFNNKTQNLMFKAVKFFKDAEDTSVDDMNYVSKYFKRLQNFKIHPICYKYNRVLTSFLWIKLDILRAMNPANLSLNSDLDRIIKNRLPPAKEIKLRESIFTFWVHKWLKDRFEPKIVQRY